MADVYRSTGSDGVVERFIDMGAGTGTQYWARSVASTSSLGWFDVTLTTVQVNAGTSAIVPGIAGKQFYPVFAAMSATGTPSSRSAVNRPSNMPEP